MGDRDPWLLPQPCQGLPRWGGLWPNTTSLHLELHPDFNKKKIKSCIKPLSVHGCLCQAAGHTAVCPSPEDTPVPPGRQEQRYSSALISITQGAVMAEGSVSPPPQPRLCLWEGPPQLCQQRPKHYDKPQINAMRSHDS